MGYRGEDADLDYRQPGGLRYGHSESHLLQYPAQLRVNARELTLRIGIWSRTPVYFRFARKEVTRVLRVDAFGGGWVALEHACKLYPPLLYFDTEDFDELRLALLKFGYRVG